MSLRLQHVKSDRMRPLPPWHLPIEAHRDFAMRLAPGTSEGIRPLSAVGSNEAERDSRKDRGIPPVALLGPILAGRSGPPGAES